MTDTNKTQLLAREVLDIIYELPDKIVEKIILAWEDGTKIDKYNVTKITGVSGQKIYRLSRLLEQHGEVDSIEENAGQLTVMLTPEATDYSELSAALVAAGHRLTLFREEEVNLESAFMALTNGTGKKI